MRPLAGTSRRSGSEDPIAPDTYRGVIRSLSPLDIVTIIFLLGSAIFIFAGWADLENTDSHLGIRFLLICGILVLAWVTEKRATPLLRFAHHIYPIFFTNYFYAETSYLKNILVHVNLDPLVARWEEGFFGCQPSISFSGNFSSPWFNEIMHLFYFSYYILIISITAFLYLKAGERGIRGVFIVFCSFYIYYIIFALVPVVGPQYYFQGELGEVPRPYFFGKLMDFILQNAEEPTGAFPSSHVGIAFILGWLTYRNLSKYFILVLPFVAGICFATVYLKAHYLLDVIAGIISAPILYLISAGIYRWLRPLKNSAI